MSVLATISLLVLGSICQGFNVDTKFPVIYSGPKGSYFGYTAALHRNSKGPLALVGAPKANSTTLKDEIYEPGALFRCDISGRGAEDSCKEISLMKEGNKPTWSGDESSYFDRKDGMWLGVSLDVRQNASQNDVVVCGHLWKNNRFMLESFVHGICYVIDSDLDENTVRKLLPLVRKSQLYTRINGEAQEYNFAYGQAGISAAFTEDESLVLGAPGIYGWTGSLVKYPIYAGRSTAMYDAPLIPRTFEDKYNCYFGYSFSPGKFFENKPFQYAVGAPRDDANHGMVYIVSVTRQRIVTHQMIRGGQLGEYFGASVLGVDLNGDSFTDMLVGAPLSSEESAGDEGRVYVYVSNGKDLQDKGKIEGTRRPGARFGTAIANVGDINQDGFTDIAVGAPYEEGHGAVYIYHGTRYGLNKLHAQRISASLVDRRLFGFGIHVSRGLDIDDNGYPDILVGSYNSSNAVLFRSRPVIQVHSRLDFKPEQIYIQVPCEKSLTNNTCVQIDACILYTGEHVPDTLEFKLSLLIEDRRGYFEDGKSRNVAATTSLSVGIRRTECHDFRMYLHSGIRDVLSPIQVQFSHALKPRAGSDDAFDKTFPVYYPKSRTNVTSQVPFHTGCGKTNECRSDLKVTSVRLDPPQSSDSLTLGTVSSVSLKITVRNEGEPAYLAELLVHIPPEISTINQDICESDGQRRKASLICDLGNPLKNDTQVTLHMKLDTTKIPPHTEYLELTFEAVTISTDTNATDSVDILALAFDTVYDIGVTGFSSLDQVVYDGTEVIPSVISHTYIVKNYGPSPLRTIHFSLDVPNELKTSEGPKTILSFTGLDTGQRSSSSVPVSCDVSSIVIKPLDAPHKHRGKEKEGGIVTLVEAEDAFNVTSSKQQPSDLKMGEERQEKVRSKKDKVYSTNSGRTPTIKISCDNKNIRCVNVPCTASSFNSSRAYAEISVSFYINFTVLNEYLGEWDHLELLTNSTIRVESNKTMAQNIQPDEAQAKTDIVFKGPPPPEILEQWIIFVSIGVGILLLLIIFILLIKIGFFRRKEKDKMRRMISESKRVKKKPEDEVEIKEEDECEIKE